MDERKINGGDVVLSIKDAADWLLIVCEDEVGFDRSNDTIDANSKCGPDTIPGTNPERTISGSGKIFLGTTAEATFSQKASEAKLDDLLQARTVFDWKIGPALPQPGDVTYSGKGFLTSLNATWSNNEVATFEYEISVKGNYTKVITPAA